ncbi:MAG: tRNA (guanosine(46)-N7)-methyltransferase TrmB [Myxococcota bacterium]
MSRTLKYDIPGPDWRIRPDDVRESGWEKIFEREISSLRLIVDVGFGRGEFLTQLAQRDPGSAVLGVEYSYKRTLKLARRLARSDLCNVRLIEATAEQVVGELLPDASVTTFWINFPDPWPKKRHHRRRLIGPDFARELARRLVLGGVVHVATDHAEYAEVIDAALAGEPLLENLYAPEPFRGEASDRDATAYELEWRAQGRRFHFFAYRRRG